MSQHPSATRGSLAGNRATGRRGGRVTTAAISLVAGLVGLVVGANPATAAPVIGQIAAAQLAADEAADELAARGENFEAVLAELDQEAPVTSQDLDAPAWEPDPNPSSGTATQLPAPDLPPVGDDPGQEGASEPVEDVPSPAPTSAAPAAAALDAVTAATEGPEPETDDRSEASDQSETPAATTADLGAGPAQIGVDGMDVTVTGDSGQAANGQVRLAGASVTPQTPGDLPGLLVRVEAASGDEDEDAVGKQAAGREKATESDQAAPTDGVVQVQVDYESLASGAGLPGGGWASRLTLVDVSDCTAEDLAGGTCVAMQVPQVSNDVDTQQLSAPVGVSGSQAVTLMVTAGASGGSGDWGATSLAPSASWGVSGNSGGFTWSYPLTMPSVAGPGPQLSLSYSSQASDGRVATSNNQAGAVGEGWSLTDSYIERKFTPCADDQDDVDGESPNNADHATGDMCVGVDNATMVLDGQAVDLIKTADGTWRPKKIDGTKIERKTGASNGDEEGQWWLVTTSDGTKYRFGTGERASDGLKTGASWTMPVYGNHPGEACYHSGADGGFGASKCRQTYRWMLEHVTEPVGGTVTYVYSKETRRYGHNLSDGTSTYTAGGYLKRILYGTRTSTEDDGPAPVRVDLEHTTRCVPGDGVSCGAGKVKDNLDAWPDVPGDLVCYKSDDECGIDAISPAFYSLYRLARITTRVHDGSGYKPVDSWRLNQSFVSPGDGSLGDGGGKVLWLRSIQHTGHAGTTATSDDLAANKVKFAFNMMPGRIDTGSDGLPPMYRPRVTGVRTESGGVVSPNYRTECGPGDVPADTDAAKRDNTRLCFPVEWRGEDLPVDWFHKYVITSVHQAGTSLDGGGDLVTGSADVVTSYRYDGGAKWVKPTGPLTDPDDVTWSEFRGYRTVVTTTGEGSEASSTTTRYLRGIEDSSFDVGPAGHRTTVGDHDALAGQVVETIKHNGTDDAQAVSRKAIKQKTPVTVATGVDGRKSVRLTGSVVYGYSMDAAGQIDSRTKATTTLNAQGEIKQAADAGDLDVSGDETCTKISYAHSGNSALAAKNMMSLVERTQTFAVSCGDMSAGHVSRPGDVISDGYAVYNGSGQPTEKWTVDPALDRRSGTLGDADGVGYVRVQKMEYDGLGRVVSDTDVAGRTTTNTYTPAMAPIATKVVTTGADPDDAGPKTAMATTMRFNQTTGLMVSATDPNGQTTRGAYDGLGRLGAITYAQHEDLSMPSIEYEYTTRLNGLNAVMTRTLGADSEDQPVQRVSVTFYDGLMRAFQTQDEAVDTGELRQDDAATRGRQISQVFYDTAGRMWKATSPQLVTGLVSNTPVQPDLIAPAATVSSYDGAGRPIDQIFYVGNPDNHANERWRTVTRYDGKYTTVVPPKGGVARTTVTDALGRTTALWEHKSRPTVDSDTADGHWWAPSTLPGFDARTEPASSYRKTTYDYDRFGLMTAMTGLNDARWTYGYDMGGRQVRASDPDSGVTTTTYDEAGNVAETVNGNGNAAGATQTVVDANTLVHSYDRLGRPIRTADGAGQIQSRWTYDVTPGADGFPVKGLPSSSTRIVDGMEYTTRVNEYDKALRPTSQTVELPEDLAGLDGLLGREFTTTTDYRIDGSVRQQVLPAISQAGQDGAAAGSVLGQEHVTTFYDDAGLPVWMGGGFGWGTYVADSQFTAKGQPQAFDLGTTYGAVATWDYEHGTERLTAIGLSREQYDSRDVDTSYGYDPAGNVTSIRNAPGVGDAGNESPQINDDNQCFEYSGLGRLTAAWTAVDGTCADTAADVTASQVGGPEDSAAPYWHEYTYDITGNRTSLTEHVLDGGTDIVQTTYEHGGGGPHQATRAVQASGPEAEIDSAPRTVVGEYSYDAAGNQTSRTVSDPVDPADSTQVEADVDSDGLLTTSQTLSWDGGVLDTVATSGENAGGNDGIRNGDAQYVYSAGGGRLTRTDANGTTVFLPGGQEITVTEGSVSAVRYYSFAGQLVAVRNQGGLDGVTSLICDHQGSVMAAVPNTDWSPDAVTRVYTDPFGADRTPEQGDLDTGQTSPDTSAPSGGDGLPGDRRFLAGEGGVDDTATGFIQLGARYYDPSLGRFLSVDPLLDLGTPAHQDAYGYGYQNPATFSDPSGTRPVGADGTGVTVGWGDDAEMTPAEVADAVSTNTSSGGSSTPGALQFTVRIYTETGNDSTPEPSPSPGPAPVPPPCFDRGTCNSDQVETWWDKYGHTVLDVGGFIPVVGIGADVPNAAWYCAEGAYLDCTVTIVGLVPAVGDGIQLIYKGGKWIWKGVDAAVTASKKNADEAADVANAGCKGGACDVPGGTCFIAGTLILTQDGPKPIEEIEAGDKVWAKNLATGKDVLRAVDKTFVRHAEQLVHLTIDGETLSTTAEHPFWIDGRGWVEAGDLKPRDVLATPDGVATLDRKLVEQRSETVYNFRVPGLHNYYALAGDTPVLVHNANYPGLADFDGILRPGGSPLGVRGSDDTIRELNGTGLSDAEAMFEQLRAGGEVVADNAKMTRVKLPNGGFVQLRTEMSRSPQSAATIDINIPGFDDIKKVKFNP